MKKIAFFWIVLISLATYCQNEQTGSDNFDYLNYRYKYLDSKFSINIDSLEFNKTLTKYKFIKNRINTYKDSLGVVLMNEFGDWKKARMAELRITYTWTRVGHHLWKKENEVISIAKEMSITHPYNLQELFYNPDGNKKITSIIENLRSDLLNRFKLDTLISMDNKALMRFAFNKNPDVLKLKTATIHKKNIENFKIKHGRLPNSQERESLGLSCGKENCCQLQN